MSWWSIWFPFLRRLAPAPAPPAVTGHPEPPPDPDRLEVDAEGWLVGARVVQIPSVRTSLLTTPGEVPIGVVLHYTATDHGTARSLAKRIATYRRGIDRAASWNILIAADGTIYQSAPLTRGTWHCAKGLLDGHKINACTIGVELEGHGVERSGAPPAQVESLDLFLCLVGDTYQIPGDRLLLEHRKYDPTRRADPGDGWAKIAHEIVFGSRVA